MSVKKPVIFLAFANDRVDEAAYLRNLPKEQEGIRQALRRAQQAGLCEVVERSNATVRQILDIFQRSDYQGRIAIFHYGGHANGYQLLLETLSGEHASAHSDGLIPFLAGQNGLKLIFLNGCSSQQQADELIKAGVPSVIGTSQSINDDVATQLAIRFYSGLGEGLSIDKSWHGAVDEVKIEKGTSNLRDLFWEEAEITNVERFPWDINFREGAEIIRNWNLPEEVDNPLFGLPSIPPTYHLPDDPFLYLQRYQRPQSEVFFGRAYDIRALYNLVTDDQSPPLVLLYGQSGVGKSSLIDSGFKPRLEQTHHIWYLRRDQGISVPELFEQAADLRESILASSDSTEDTADKKAYEEAQKLADFQSKLEELSASYHPDLPEEMKEILQQMIVELRASRDFYLLKQRRFLRKKQGQATQISIDTSMPPEEMSLLDQWIYLEEVTGKPLIIIVDQLESIFTIPDPNLPTEFEDFIEDVRQLFSNPMKLPKGKLILSYRKEYHPEIDEKFKDVQIPRSRLFIQHLERKEIIEVVTGLIKTERTRQQYKLYVEDGLPEIIADDLLEDKESPIAPVLQILLTKLWHMTKEDDGGNRQFTIARYQQLRQEGILMDDFYEQQMAVLKKWDNEVVTSGLALDVMMFHASSLMAADLRTHHELITEYAENLEVLEPLVEKLMELYLLSGIQVGDDLRTTLAHDTLAPVVFMQYRSSDYPGQRARRILENKIESYNPEDAGSMLDEADLAVVEGGHYGMRAWTEKEEELVAKSRIRRNLRGRARERRRRLGIIAVILIAGLAIFAGAEAWKAKQATIKAELNREEAELNRAKAEESQKKANAAKAFAEKEAKLAKIAETEARQQREIAEKEKLKAQAAQALAAQEALRAQKAQARAQKSLIFAKEKEADAIMNSRIARAREIDARRSARKADSLSNIARTKALALKSINLGLNQNARVIGGILALNAFKDIKKFGGNQEDKDVYQALRVAWSRLDQQSTEIVANQGEIEILRTTADNLLLSAGTNGTIQFWDLNSNPIRQQQTALFCQEERCYITSLELSPNGRWMATGHTDNKVRLWDLQKNGDGVRRKVLRKSIEVLGHNAPIIAVSFKNDNEFITIDQSGVINYWQVNKIYKPIKTQRLGQTVSNAAKHPKEAKILIASTNNQISLLDIKSAAITSWLPAENALLGNISTLKFSPSGKFVGVGMKNGYAALFEYSAQGYSLIDIKKTYLNEWAAHISEITDIAFSPNEKYFATCSYDKTGKLFDLKPITQGFISPEPVVDLQYNSWIRTIAFSADGENFLLGGESQDVSIHKTNIAALSSKIQAKLQNEIATPEKIAEVAAELALILKRKQDYEAVINRALEVDDEK